MEPFCLSRFSFKKMFIYLRHAETDTQKTGVLVHTSNGWGGAEPRPEARSLPQGSSMGGRNPATDPAGVQ